VQRLQHQLSVATTAAAAAVTLLVSSRLQLLPQVHQMEVARAIEAAEAAADHAVLL
jgi:hypothetical protein